MPITSEQRAAAVREAQSMIDIGLDSDTIVSIIKRKYGPIAQAIADNAEHQESRLAWWFRAPLPQGLRESLSEGGDLSHFALGVTDALFAPAFLIAAAAGGPVARLAAGVGPKLVRAMLAGRAGESVLQVLSGPVAQEIYHAAGFQLPFTAAQIAERIDSGEPFAEEAAKTTALFMGIDLAFRGITGQIGRAFRQQAQENLLVLQNEKFARGLPAPPEHKLLPPHIPGHPLGTAPILTEPPEARVLAAALKPEVLDRLGVPPERVREALQSLQPGTPLEEPLIRPDEPLHEALGRLRARLADPRAGRLEAQALSALNSEILVGSLDRVAAAGGLTFGQQEELLRGSLSHLLQLSGSRDGTELAARYPVQVRAAENAINRFALARETAERTEAGAAEAVRRRGFRTSDLRPTQPFERATGRMLDVGEMIHLPGDPERAFVVRAVRGGARLVEITDREGNTSFLRFDDEVVRQVGLRGLVSPGAEAMRVSRDLYDPNRVVLTRAPDLGPSRPPLADAPALWPDVQQAKARELLERLDRPSAAAPSAQAAAETEALAPETVPLQDTLNAKARALLERPPLPSVRTAIRATERLVQQEAKRINELSIPTRRLLNDAERTPQLVQSDLAALASEQEALLTTPSAASPKLPSAPEVPTPARSEFATLVNRIRELGGDGIETVWSGRDIGATYGADQEATFYRARMADKTIEASTLHNLRTAIENYQPPRRLSVQGAMSEKAALLRDRLKECADSALPVDLQAASVEAARADQTAVRRLVKERFKE